MRDTTHKVTPQPNTVFGDLYVREQHNDAAGTIFRLPMWAQ